MEKTLIENRTSTSTTSRFCGVFFYKKSGRRQSSHGILVVTMSESSVAKNTLFMTLSAVGQKLIAFVYFTLIARSIGVEETGKYFFALSFTTVFVVLVDVGLTTVGIREIAKAKERAQEYLSTLLGIKMILGVSAYVLMVLALFLLNKPADVRHLVYISGITMLFDSFHLTMYGVLRAMGKLQYEAISITVSQALSLILGSVFLWFNFPLPYLMIAFLIPSVCNVLYVRHILKTRYQLFLRPEFPRERASALLRMGIPFAVAAILARCYSYLDSILLSAFAGDVAVGLYSVPYKITYAFQFLPLSLMAALYPKLSEYAVHDTAKLRPALEESVKYLLMIVMGITVGIGVLARDILHLVYTEKFASSVLPLQILLVGLIFSYVSFPFGAMLNASNRQKTQTMIVALTLCVNTVLNVLLIPRIGVTGAAIAALVGNCCLALCGYGAVARVVSLSHRQMALLVLRIGAAALLMGAIVWYVNEQMSLVLAIALGVVIYPLFLFGTRVMRRSDIQFIRMILQRT